MQCKIKFKKGFFLFVIWTTTKLFFLLSLCINNHQTMNSSEKIICPLCNDIVDKLLYRFHIDGERKVIEQIKINNPQWAEQDGICSRCVDYYHVQIIREQRILPEIGPHFS